MNFFNSDKDIFWPCSMMQLYTDIKKNKFSRIFELEKKEEDILYIVENSKLIASLIKKIKETKSITIRDKKTVSEIDSTGLLKGVKCNNDLFRYNLVILCTGNNSVLVNKLFDDRSLKYSYEEISTTTILNHDKLKNNIARQIFLDNEILALLPISNFKTSIVWSVKKNIYKKNKLFTKKRIKKCTKNFLKNIKFKNKIEYFDLNFLIREKYYKDRILLFGNALHVIHPLVGQGFNMVLRDLKSLNNELDKRINLGLDIGSSDILIEFTNSNKPGNFVFAVGTDVLRNCFNFKNESINELRNKAIIALNKNNFAKNIIYKFANEGIKF